MRVPTAAAVMLANLTLLLRCAGAASCGSSLAHCARIHLEAIVLGSSTFVVLVDAWSSPLSLKVPRVTMMTTTPVAEEEGPSSAATLTMPSSKLNDLTQVQARASRVVRDVVLSGVVPEAAEKQQEPFDPVFRNAHVQTILGGFFWRDWALYVPAKHTMFYMAWAAIVSTMGKYQHAPPSGVNNNNNNNNNVNFWDHRERVSTPDGDWFHADTKVCGSDSDDDDDDAQDKTEGRPLVILLHGLNSSSESGVSRDLARAFCEAGMDCTCLNFRGCSGEPNDTLRFYHLGFTDDVQHYLDLLVRRGKTNTKKNHNRPVYLAGFSLGANVVLQFLGELGTRAITDYRIAGAAVWCVPLQHARNAPALERPFEKAVYARNLLRGLQDRATTLLRSRCKDDSMTNQFNYSGAMTATTLPEFDDAFTAPIYGYRDVWDYYNQTSSLYSLQGIAVPTLILNAEDDPFFDPTVWPVDQSSNHGGHAPLKLVRTSYGGHLGFAFHRVLSLDDDRLIQLDNVLGRWNSNGDNQKRRKKQPAPSWAARHLAHFLWHVGRHPETERLHRDRDRYLFYQRTSIVRFSNFRRHGSV